MLECNVSGANGRVLSSTLKYQTDNRSNNTGKHVLSKWISKFSSQLIMQQFSSSVNCIFWADVKWALQPNHHLGGIKASNPAKHCAKLQLYKTSSRTILAKWVRLHEDEIKFPKTELMTSAGIKFCALQWSSLEERAESLSYSCHLTKKAFNNFLAIFLRKIYFVFGKICKTIWSAEWKTNTSDPWKNAIVLFGPAFFSLIIDVAFYYST